MVCLWFSSGPSHPQPSSLSGSVSTEKIQDLIMAQDPVRFAKVVGRGQHRGWHAFLERHPDRVVHMPGQVDGQYRIHSPPPLS